ncbi:MAG: AAA family ATPase [Deltaproteobacteria bacterium]|nr:AAA family ATPase [Deltaproteobacteria bacterium]
MIRRIKLRQEFAQTLGLQECEFKGLGDVVALTGPNGGGKTRILKALQRQWKEIDKVARRSYLHLDKSMDLNDLVFHVTRNAEPGKELAVALPILLAGVGLILGASLPADHGADEQERWAPLKRAIESARESVAEDVRWISDTVTLDVWEDGQLSRTPTMVYVGHSAERYERDDDYDYDYGHRNTRLTVKKALGSPRSEMLDDAAFALYMAAHPDWCQRHGGAIERARSIQRILMALAGLDLSCEPPEPRYPRGHARLSGRAVNLEELSPGQRLLLRWIELVHDEVDDVRDTILFIDEPEQSLHPGLLIATLEKLRGLRPAQIWVATHSLPLLAHIGHENIHYVSNGSAQWAGNKTLMVQKGLLGGDQGVSRLRAFLGDAETLAFHHFVAQCLTKPGSVTMHADDRQARQFASMMQERLAHAQETRVLDYAAGRGRLAQALAGIPADSRKNLDYHAYNDPRFATEDERAACNLSTRHLRADDDGYLESLDKFDYDEGAQADIVILCNVLHEIPSEDWPRVMKEIHACLRAEGHLLILEDQQMRVGELPHERGFLVLHREALGKLFDLDSKELGEIRQRSHDQRLTIYEVPKHFLGRCTDESRRAALERVRKRALEQIELLRAKAAEPGQEHRRGREHAYYSMLHTNAVLALK